jgi:hypothetical protein
MFVSAEVSKECAETANDCCSATVCCSSGIYWACAVCAPSTDCRTAGTDTEIGADQCTDTEIGTGCCSAGTGWDTGDEISTDHRSTGTERCAGASPRTCTGIFARRRHTATRNWCVWRRGPSLETDAGKSRATAQGVYCLSREPAATEDAA